MPIETVRMPTGTASTPAFPRVLESVRDLAAGGLRALLLSGSHAAGEAVWAEANGRRISLSDLDLYLILDSDRAREAAIRRGAAARGTIEALGREEGLHGPVEIAYLTESALAALPARPGTLELRRHGQVVAGDPALRERIPDYRPAEVSAEERLLLLENRSFELLLAHPAVAGSGAEERLAARHALHKTALDLALVRALERGEFPDGAHARVQWARRHAPEAEGPWGGAPCALAAELGAVWDEALAWRERGAAPPAAPVTWRAVARAWCATWAAFAGRPERTPYARARLAARRAPLRRRVRLALRPEQRSDCGAPLFARLRHAAAGTPQHRVNAAAAVLLFAATQPGASETALDPAASGALRALGLAPRDGWAATARSVARAWDCWVLEGRRVSA